jgi:hypothetical protein
VRAVHFELVLNCCVHVFAHVGVEECTHQEEIPDNRMFYLVVLMDHLCFVVGAHDPVIRAQVEVVWMCNFLRVSDLNLRCFNPRDHLRVEIKVVIDRVVIELLFLDF